MSLTFKRKGVGESLSLFLKSDEAISLMGTRSRKKMSGEHAGVGRHPRGEETQTMMGSSFGYTESWKGWVSLRRKGDTWH